MAEFTDKEFKWLKEADRVFKRKPKKLMLYSCDSDIVVCKKGANCGDVCHTISNSDINCCAVIVDVHDDFGHGA